MTTPDEPIVLTEAHLRVAQAAATDNPGNARSILRAVNIGTEYVSATDGYMAVRVPLAEKREGGDINVPAKALAKIKLGKAPWGTAVELWLDRDEEDRAHIKAGDSETMVDVIPGDFPNTAEHIARGARLQPQAKVALEIGLLEKLISALPPDAVALRLYIGGPSDAVCFEARGGDGPHLEGAIMPFSIDWRKEGASA